MISGGVEQDFLHGLHKLLADKLTAQLRSGEELTPALLKEVREFLKDNGIQGAKNNTALQNLTRRMPFGPEVEDAELPGRAAL